jgi:SAM-dependent methyltransferase
MKQWDYSTAGSMWVGGRFPCNNKSKGYHGLLLQWWEYYAENCTQWILLGENEETAIDFKVRYPKKFFSTLELDGSNMTYKADICSQNIKAEVPDTFEVVVCQALFEHLFDPVQALKNMVELIDKEGFIFIHTHPVPGIPYHAHPRDYLRYFPDWFEDATKYINGLTMLELYNNKSSIFIAYKVKNE